MSTIKMKWILLACLIPALPVMAAEDAYSLDPVMVTAMKLPKTELETPADTTLVTQEELMQTGQTYLSSALAYVPGIVVAQMGPNDQSWITGNTDVILRGVTGGTLVLIDNVPVNFNGVSHLDALPVMAVERVEIVKGAGAVLYGSGAYGGVINVITKKENKNTVYGEIGTAQRGLGLSTQVDKLSIDAYVNRYEEVKDASANAGTKKFKGVSEPYHFDFGTSRKEILRARFEFNEKLDLSYLHSRKKHSISYVSPKTIIGEMQHFDYDDREDFLTLHHSYKNLDGNLYFQQRNIHNPDIYTNHPEKVEWEKSLHKVYGYDVRNVWENEKDDFILGGAVRYETYENDNQKFAKFGDSESALKDPAHFGKYETKDYALYGQWSHDFSERLSSVLSFRQEWVKTDTATISEFLPQAQVLYRIDDKQSFYGNMGKSFRMPTFRNLFYSSGALAANPDLEPEYGIHYEVGYKYQGEKDSFRISAFKLDLKDQLASRKLKDGRSQTYNAAAYKNRGLEINYSHNINDKLSFEVGGMYGNPERQNKAGEEWKRVLGKYQITSGLVYKAVNKGASLHFTYFGDRIYSANQADKAPLVMSNLTTWYKHNDQWEASFTVNNLFNRKDATNQDSSYDFYVPEHSGLFKMSYFF